MRWNETMAVKTLGYYLDRLRLSFRSEVCTLCQQAHVKKQRELVCPLCEKQALIRQPIPLEMLPAGPIYAACGFPYKMKNLLYGLKFKHKTQHGLTLAEVLIHYWQQLPQAEQSRWIVVPIPSHDKTKLPHVSLIARPFASHFGYDFIENGLEWKRSTQLQHTLLNKRKRRENIAGALQVGPELQKRIKPGGRILVVDDLITTGATMAEAMSTVHRANPDVKACALAVSYVPLALTRYQL